MKKIRVGVIGTSAITKNTVDLLNGELQHFYEVVAVFTRNVENAKNIMQTKSIEIIDTDYDMFLSHKNIDLVYVASPNSLHFDQVIKALLAGKHVVVEKPAFETVEQWDKAYEVARKHNVFLIEAIRNIYEPTFEIVRNTVSNLSQIDGVFWNFQQHSSRIDAVYNGQEPNVFSMKFSGGVLMDLGVYTIYPAIALFGYPKNYQYIARKLSTGVDGSGTIILNYEDFDVVIRISKCVQSDSKSEIYSKNLVYSISKLSDMKDFVLTDNGKVINLAPLNDSNVLYSEWADFYDMITQNNIEKYEQVVDLGRQVVKLMQQLRYKADIVYDIDSKLEEIKGMKV